MGPHPEKTSTLNSLPPVLQAVTLAVGDPALERFILQMFIVLLVARLLGEAAERAGFVPIVGELLTGVVLSPSLLGWVAPDVFAVLFPVGVDGAVALDAVGQLGLLFLLVLAGLETDVNLVRRRISTTTIVAIGSILIPFLSGFALGWIVPDTYLTRPDHRLLFAFFLATALSISAVPVIAAYFSISIELKLNSPNDWFQRLLCYNVSG